MFQSFSDSEVLGKVFKDWQWHIFIVYMFNWIKKDKLNLKLTLDYFF